MNVPDNATMGSLNRKQRRAAAKTARQELKNNNAWDDLRSLNQSCAALLLNNAHVGRIVNDKLILSHVKDLDTLTRLIKLLTTDLNNMKKELDLIGALHADRTGKADENDILLTFQIAEKYHLFTEQHTANVQPTVNHILELTAQAEQALVDAQNGIQEIQEVVVEEAEETSLASRAEGAAMNGDVVDVTEQQ